jgi:hypothetical protein
VVIVQQLANAVKKEADILNEVGDNWKALHGGMQDAAEEWAKAALQNYRGRNLRKALAISEAIVEFLSEMEEKNTPHEAPDPCGE